MRTQDQVPNPASKDRVMHRGDCPTGLGGRPDPHRGRKFAGVQRQLTAAALLGQIRTTASNIRNMVEEGRTGDEKALLAVALLEEHVAELRDVVQCAVNARKE